MRKIWEKVFGKIPLNPPLKKGGGSQQVKQDEKNKKFSFFIPLFSKGDKKQGIRQRGILIRNFAGFSLIELLVAMTIGGVILTAVMTSYVAMTKTSLRLDLARQMQKETNFAVIRMVDKIRNYPIKNCDEKKLVLQNRQGHEITFKFLLENKQQLTLNEQPLFSENIAVDDGHFDCKGLDDEENPAKIQPRVQIYLQVSAKKDPEITNRVQTTISSRIFN